MKPLPTTTKKHEQTKRDQDLANNAQNQGPDSVHSNDIHEQLISTPIMIVTNQK